MKRGTLALLMVVLFLAIGAAAGAFIFHGGLSARATPSALEASIARSVRHLAIPSSARATANPVPSSPQFLREARLHFADHCAFCHANDGSGAAIIGSGLYPKPPDLRLPRTQNLSDGELFWIIENGIRFTGMPAFASHGEEAGSWKLVHFIRHLPQLTPEERAEMERYNPKGPEEREEEQQERDFLNGAPPQPAQQPSHHH